MKIRTDFVTNSSSSSFIIGYKDVPEVDKDVLKRYPFFKNIKTILDTILFVNGDGYETSKGEVISNKKELELYLRDNYSYNGDYTSMEDILNNTSGNSEEDFFNDCPECIDMYKKISEYLDKGYKILFKDIDYSDTSLVELYYSLAENENYFVIIEGDR